MCDLKCCTCLPLKLCGMQTSQVQLQSMYELYYAADPSTHTPPIPTVNLRLTHPQERESELCNGAESTDNERDAAKTALLDAVFDLEKALAPEHPVRYLGGCLLS